MRKAISSLLCSAMIAATALPAFAGDISATGQFQSTYVKSATSDATLKSTFQLDLKGAMTDTFDIDARLLMKRDLVVDKYLHFATAPNFDTVKFDTYKITHHNTINLAGSDLKYTVDFTGKLNVNPSSDPMTLIYEKGASGDAVELFGQYKNMTGRLGLMAGVAGKWYGQVVADDVVPGLQLGGITYNEFLPGINPEDEQTYNKPVFSGYINGIFGTYKPVDNALKGLELTAGYYVSKQPDSTARPTGPVLESDEFIFNEDQLAAQGMRNVLGKGYKIAIRGEFTRQPGTDRWCPGDGNWDRLQTEDYVVEERDGKVYIKGSKLLEIARKNGREVDLSRDNSRHGGIKLIAFDAQGNRVMTNGQFDNNTQLSTLLTDPTRGKINGNAAVLYGKYERGALIAELDAKKLNNHFDATTTNFYKKNDTMTLDDRGETKIPVLRGSSRVTTTRTDTGAVTVVNTIGDYAVYDASKGFIKANPSVEYKLNDIFTLRLDGSYKMGTRITNDAEDFEKYYYYMARPKISVDYDQKYLAEVFVEVEKMKTKTSRLNTISTSANTETLTEYFDREGAIKSYNAMFEADDAIPYIEKAKIQYQSRKLDGAAGNTGQKDNNKSQIDLTVDSVEYKDFKYSGTYKLEGKAYNDNTVATDTGVEVGDIEGFKSSLLNSVTYKGVQDLTVKLSNQLAYSRDKTGSQWNWIIGEANYKIKDTPYKLANNIELKFFGKYNLEEELDGTNKSAMYINVKKSFTDLTTLELKYGADSETDYYNYDKNEIQKRETTLEFISRF